MSSWVLRKVVSKDFWLLFLASLTMFFMWAWRAALRDAIFRSMDAER